MAEKPVFKGLMRIQLDKLTLDEFSRLVPARQRRSIKRGFTSEQKKFLRNIRDSKGKDEVVRTHCRDMIIIPEMIDSKIGIYNGKEFLVVTIVPEMLGHYLGEYALTRKRVKHSSPGFGATRSSKFVPLK